MNSPNEPGGVRCECPGITDREVPGLWHRAECPLFCVPAPTTKPEAIENARWDDGRKLTEVEVLASRIYCGLDEDCLPEHLSGDVIDNAVIHIAQALTAHGNSVRGEERVNLESRVCPGCNAAYMCDCGPPKGGK